MGIWGVGTEGWAVGGPGVLAGGSQWEEEMQQGEEGELAPTGVSRGYHPDPVGLCGGMP